MGIDNTVFGLTTANMLDQRAQLFSFVQPRWLATNDQQPMMNITELETTMGFQPLGLDTPQSWPLQGTGHTSTVNRFSENRSASTDTACSTPDRNGTDFGNDFCHSPNSECSVLTDDRSSTMGTPNSFSSGRFDSTSPSFMHTHRERLYSTSSMSAYPTSTMPEQEEHVVREESWNPVLFSPSMHRQNSLALVEEVLGKNDSAYEQLPLEGLSQTVTQFDEEESCLPQSPSYLAHFTASTEPVRLLTSSQTDQFLNFGGTGINGMQCEGSPCPSSGTQPLSRENSNNNNCGDSNDNCVATTAEYQESSAQTSFVATGQMDVTASTTSVITDLIPSHSLDVGAMMMDAIESLQPAPEPKPQEPALQTICMDDIVLEEVKEMPLQENKEQRPKKTPSRGRKATPKTKIPQDAPSTSKSENLDPSTERRERNNEACRLSRKRRKDKRAEMDILVEKYSTENVELQSKIEQLERECKRVRECILTSMTNK